MFFRRALNKINFACAIIGVYIGWLGNGCTDYRCSKNDPIGSRYIGTPLHSLHRPNHCSYIYALC